MRYQTIYPSATVKGGVIYVLDRAFYSWAEALEYKKANATRIMVDICGAEIRPETED